MSFLERWQKLFHCSCGYYVWGRVRGRYFYLPFISQVLYNLYRLQFFVPRAWNKKVIFSSWGYYIGGKMEIYLTLPSSKDAAPSFKWLNCLIEVAKNGPVIEVISITSSIHGPEHCYPFLVGNLLCKIPDRPNMRTVSYNCQEVGCSINSRAILFFKSSKGERDYPENQVPLFHACASSDNITGSINRKCIFLYWLLLLSSQGDFRYLP